MTRSRTRKSRSRTVKPVRITIVNQYYPPDQSPTGRLAASLAEHRARAGDEVTVVTSTGRYTGGPDESDAHHGEERDDPGCPVTVLRIAAPRRPATSLVRRALQYIAFYLGAWRQLRRLPRQDLIVCMTTPPFIAAVALAHRRKHRRDGVSRLVLWNMDCYPEILEVAGLIRSGGVAARICHRVNRWLFRRLDHVVCLDDAMRDRLELRHGTGRHAPRFSVIPNWESLARFPNRIDPPPWAGRERLELGDRFVVLYQGNAGYGHEFDTVIDAAETLRDDGVVFLFIGGGVHHQRIGQAAADRNLENVRCHPYVPEAELPSALGTADAGLITLADDAAGVMSPSKLHAYLAASVPVVYVGPAGGNVAAAIERFACGVQVRRHDGISLAECVRKVKSERRWLAAMKRRARYAFEQAYCDDKTLPQFDAVIDSTVNRPCDAAVHPPTPVVSATSGDDERAVA